MSYNQLLQPSASKLTANQLEKARKLEKEGLIEDIAKHKYIKCVSQKDKDYFETKERGCDTTIDITDEESGFVSCTGCGRDIELRLKESHLRWSITRDNDGVYEYVRDELKSGVNGQASKIDNGLLYLDQRIKPAFNIRYQNVSARVIIVFEYISSEILDVIQIFNQPTIVVLVGNSVPQANQYSQRNIPYILISELIDEKSSEVDDRSVFSSAHEQRTPSDQLAKKGIRLYKTYRSRYTWREFEYTVQHCLSTCFETSKLLGGEESGEQVPEGILSLDYGTESNAYIWDAKYVNDPNKTRSLSNEYEDMAKHLTDFREESNVKDIYGDVAGFLVISPGIKGSSIVRLAERIQRRLAKNNREWSGAVTHLQFESLIRLFHLTTSDKYSVQSKPKEFRKHVDRMLTRSNYHDSDSEEYQTSDQRVFDVSTSDVEEIFQRYIAPQTPESEQINIDGYLANIQSLDY